MRIPRALLAALLVAAWAAPAAPQGTSTEQGPDAATAPGPRLVVEEVAHDFGDLKPGIPLRWTFKVSNTGSADLLIKSVKPG